MSRTRDSSRAERPAQRVVPAVIALALAAPSVVAQEPERAWPEARPADVASIDAIIGVLYEVISGPAGEERDWDRFRSLFLPEGRLIPTGRTEAGAHFHRVLSPDEWIEGAEPFFEQNGFFEREIARATEEFGKVAHAFSTYESRYIAEDLEPFQRGINSIQLLHDGTRWWVATVLWMGETPEHPIPAVYLPASP